MNYDGARFVAHVPNAFMKICDLRAMQMRCFREWFDLSTDLNLPAQLLCLGLEQWKCIFLSAVKPDSA